MITVLRKKDEVREAVAAVRNAGNSVGLVPTMGYLHEGHLSLIRRARAENDLVVVSIFVNPTQFGPNEDLDRYPRDLPRDLALSEDAGADLVFHPDVGEMYAPEHSTWVDVEGLTESLCGASRLGHFRGVATVVIKLFAICRPDRAYFGQKDAQQAFVIKRMNADLDLGVDVVVCPIVREADGLALSSRNVYLSAEERAQAPVIRQAMLEGERLVCMGERSAEVIRRAVQDRIEQAPLARVDYVQVVGTQDMQLLSELDGEVLIAAAVFFGKTRLIDNSLLATPSPT